MRSFSGRVPGQAEARRQAQPVGVGVGFGYAGVAVEQQPGRRVRVHRGNLTRFESRQREVRAAAGHVVLRQRRLPAQSHVYVEALAHPDVVLEIRAPVFLAQSDLQRVPVDQQARPADHEIRQRIV